jgi:hypothetical protein
MRCLLASEARAATLRRSSQALHLPGAVFLRPPYPGRDELKPTFQLSYRRLDKSIVLVSWVSGVHWVRGVRGGGGGAGGAEG